MSIREEDWQKPTVKYNGEVVDLFLTIKEVSDLLGISVQAVHSIIKEGDIEVATKGKDTVIIYPKALNEILRFRNWPIKRKKGKKASHSVKGGVGKTSLIHTISAKLSAYGFRVLLVDVDKQANLTNSFGIDDEQDGIITLKDLFEEYLSDRANYDPSVAIIELTDYLHLIPADIGLANLDFRVNESKVNIGYLFKNLFTKIEDEYDWILFDLPCDFNSVSMAIHCYIDQCIIPVNIHKFSFKGLKLTMDHINFVDSQYKLKPKTLLVANKVDGRSTVSYERIAKLKEQYGEDVSDVIIPSCKPFENAFDSESNIWKSAKARPAAGGIEDLVWGLADLGSWAEQVKVFRQAKRSTVEVDANV